MPLRSPITTHVLDTARGLPASGVAVVLEMEGPHGDFQHLAHGITDADGRIADLLPDETPLASGTYCLTFETGAYHAAHGEATFYPRITVLFQVGSGGKTAAHHHVPLLLSPFGYSTYRGS